MMNLRRLRLPNQIFMDEIVGESDFIGREHDGEYISRHLGRLELNKEVGILRRHERNISIQTEGKERPPMRPRLLIEEKVGIIFGSN